MVRRFATPLALLLLSGCVYFNAIYNARDDLARADRARVAGRVGEARSAYEAAVERASGAVRRDPRSEWVDDALYIMGRSWFRLDELTRAVPALEQARQHADTPEVRLGSTLFLGAALARLGRLDASMQLLNEAMRELRDDPLLADAHFWRGEVHFARGEWELGYWDLARASDADERLRVPAMLERLRFAIEVGDTATQRREVEALLRTGDAAPRRDEFFELLQRAEQRSGALWVADLLADARDAQWSPAVRTWLVTERALWLRRAGHSDAAADELLWAAERAGAEGHRARVQLARLRLGQLRTLDELEAVRALLRPAAGGDHVRQLAEQMRLVEMLAWLAEREGEPLGWFAAAEEARDQLGAPHLAAQLFGRYLSHDPDGAWAGKTALALAVLQGNRNTQPVNLTPFMERMADPYVAAARTGQVGSDRVAQLESVLARRLSDLRARARTEAQRFDRALRGYAPFPEPSRPGPASNPGGR